MGDETTRNAASTAAHVLRNAFAEIREAYPFLNSDDLSETLAKMSKQLQDDLLAKEAAMKAAEDRFTIYKLPAELRVNIYKLVLARDEDKPFETQSTKLTRGGSRTILKDPMPALLRVSRQVRHEALPIFYSNTRFVATFDFSVVPSSGIPEWLKMIGPHDAGQIKDLMVRQPIGGLGNLMLMISDVASRYGRSIPLDDEYLSKVSKANTSEALQLKELGVADEAVKVAYVEDNGVGSAAWLYLD